MAEGVVEEEPAVAAEAWVAGSQAPGNSAGHLSLSEAGGAGVLETARNLLKAVPAAAVAAMECVAEAAAVVVEAVAAEGCGRSRYQAAAVAVVAEEVEKEFLLQHRLYSSKPQAVVTCAAAAEGVAAAGAHSSVSPLQEEAGVLLHRREAAAAKAVRAVVPLVAEAEEEGGATGNSRGASSAQTGRCSAVLREAADRGAGEGCPKGRPLLHASLLQTSSVKKPRQSSQCRKNIRVTHGGGGKMYGT